MKRKFLTTTAIECKTGMIGVMSTKHLLAPKPLYRHEMLNRVQPNVIIQVVFVCGFVIFKWGLTKLLQYNLIAMTGFVFDHPNAWVVSRPQITHD